MLRANRPLLSSSIPRMVSPSSVMVVLLYNRVNGSNSTRRSASPDTVLSPCRMIDAVISSRTSGGYVSNLIVVENRPWKPRL
ncbi:Uncharacterised protein [Mycobacteroides abscessus subsp. abscessus]|nr:Uncharacterised protein [Mycobacteroides abscessus subsp. abscessus]